MVILTFLLFIFVSTLEAQEGWLNGMRRAEAFFDVKEYEQARETYLTLLSKSPEEWQRAEILYNLGTLSLAESDTEKAVTILNEVPLENALKPLLTFRIYYNLAIAYLNKPTSSLEEEIDQLKRAYNYAEKAEVAFCNLQTAEGNPSCNKELLEKLKELISKRLAAPRESFSMKQQKKSSPQMQEATQQREKKEKQVQEILQRVLEMEQKDTFPTTQVQPRKQVLKPW